MKRLLLAAAAVACLTAPAAAQAPPLLNLKVKPTALDVAAGTAILEVTMTVEGVSTPAGQSVLTHLNGAPNILQPFRTEGVTATDDKGELPIATKDGGRTYVSTRDASGKLTVSYRRPISAATGGSLSTIPSVDGPGVSGILNMLFPLPTSAQRYHLTMDWDLSAMPAGSTAVTSVGEGEHIDVPSIPMARLNYVMMMAGKIKREPDPPTGAFSAVWTGEPTFDANKTMKWASQLHHHMSRFFQDPVELPYHVFMRAHGGGNGVAAPMAFTIGYTPRTTPEGVQSLLGHEMTHTWTAADIGKWYSEGNAVYYQTLLPWRFGMATTEKRLIDINLTAARYYTNDVLDADDSEVLPKFWTDMRYNVLSYDRGAIYFAVLNGKIRRKSGGKRSVDDLIRAMIQLDREEKTITEQTWIDMLQKELGDEGPAIHKGMMTGAMKLVPESDDYGPCFRRVATKIGRYDIGFGVPEITRKTLVENLRPDSNAAKAGLKNGDKVTYASSTDGAQKDPKMTVTMTVTREGTAPFEVTYLPRGELRDAYQWERVAGVPESACK